MEKIKIISWKNQVVKFTVFLHLDEKKLYIQKEYKEHEGWNNEIIPAHSSYEETSDAGLIHFLSKYYRAVYRRYTEKICSVCLDHGLNHWKI